MMRISLIFLLPACISLNTMATMEAEDIMPWLKYWTVLAFALVIEFFLLLNKIDGRILNLFKLVFIAWCLAPVYYNGSHVVSGLVLLPAHNGLLEASTVSANYPAEFAKLLSRFIETVSDSIRIAASTFMEVPNIFFDAFYKVVLIVLQMVEVILQLLISIPHKIAEFIFCDLLSVIPLIPSKCQKYAQDLGLLKAEAPPGSFNTIVNLFKSIVKKNDTNVKQERLFSKVLKEVIHKASVKKEEPRLFSQVFKKFMYG